MKVYALNIHVFDIILEENVRFYTLGIYTSLERAIEKAHKLEYEESFEAYDCESVYQGKILWTSYERTFEDKYEIYTAKITVFELND